MTGEEFYSSGRLYYINTLLLWPLGESIRLVPKRDGFGVKNHFEIVSVEPAQVIEGDSAALHAQALNAVAFIKQRLDAMAPDERHLALALLADPERLATFLPATDEGTDVDA